MPGSQERGASSLDTTQPGTRHIQTLIRQRTPVSLLLQGGLELEGTIQWQDCSFLAISQEGRPLALVSRRAMVMLRTIG
jgi:hypothetical protein